MFLYQITELKAIPERLVHPLLSLADSIGNANDLFQTIISSKANLDVWRKISELLLNREEITEAETRLPPSANIQGSPTTPPHRAGTPIKSNSGSNSNRTNQTLNQLTALIENKLYDVVHKEVEGFEQYFNEYLSNEEFDHKAICSTSELEVWLRKGPAHFEQFGLKFFQSFSDQVQSTNRYFYGSGGLPLAGARHGAIRKCDIFLARRLEESEHTLAIAGSTRHDWTNVLVLGEFKSNANEDCSRDTLLQLASCVREVFGAQPGRRLVHAFAICGSKLRFYLFDRAGVSISSATDIRFNSHLLLKAMGAYSTMTPSQLGYDERYKDENMDPFLPSSTNKIPKYLHLYS